MDLLQPVWLRQLWIFLLSWWTAVWKAYIKINITAVTRGVTEIFIRSWFSKGIKFLFLFLFPCHFRKLRAKYLCYLRMLSVFSVRKTQSVLHYQQWKCELGSLILLQQGRLENIVNIILVYILSFPRVSHQQQLQKLLLCHLNSADKNTWHFEKV